MSRKVTTILRVILGLVLVIFGANKFFNFMEMPPMQEGAEAFIQALSATGYMFPLIGLTEIIAGVLLLTNKWTGLALIFAAIISVNIVLFHLVLDPASILLALVVAILNAAVMYGNWGRFRTLW